MSVYLRTMFAKCPCWKPIKFEVCNLLLYPFETFGCTCTWVRLLKKMLSPVTLEKNKQTMESKCNVNKLSRTSTNPSFILQASEPAFCCIFYFNDLWKTIKKRGTFVRAALYVLWSFIRLRWCLGWCDYTFAWPKKGRWHLKLFFFLLSDPSPSCACEVA